MSATRMNFDIFAYHLSKTMPNEFGGEWGEWLLTDRGRQWFNDCVSMADAFEIAHPKYFIRSEFLQKCNSEYWKSRGKGRQIPKRWCK